MNPAGALVINAETGDPERQPGFTVNVAAVPRVTMRGNFTKGFTVYIGDAIALGPYRTMEEAQMQADRYNGVFERAN